MVQQTTEWAIDRLMLMGLPKEDATDLMDTLFATSAEVTTGTDTQRAVSPYTLAARLAVLAYLAAASDAQAQAKSLTTVAVTPGNLAALGASTSFAGLIELATDAEAKAMSSGSRAITPSNLGAMGATTSQVGLVALATNAQVQAKSAGSLVVSPSNLAALAAVNTVTSTAGSLVLDATAYAVHDVTLTNGSTGTAISFTTTAGSGVLCEFTLILRQNGSGGNVKTWASTVKWPSGSAANPATTASYVSMLHFWTIDGGVTWFGFQVGDHMS